MDVGDRWNDDHRVCGGVYFVSRDQRLRSLCVGTSHRAILRM